MKVVCPYCAKELNVSETELAEHGNSMVCPQCLMQFQVSGNEQALARLRESRRQASPAPLHSPAADNYVYCPHCGKQLPGDGLNYCPYCGNMLREAAYRAAANAAPDEMRVNEFDFIHAYPYARSHTSTRHVESRRERRLRRLAYVLIALLLMAIVALFVFMAKSEAPFGAA